MPFERAKGEQQYHKARVKSLSAFKPNGMRNGETFATKQISEGILAIVGKPKDGEGTEVQAFRFNKEKFSPKEARAWLRKHGYRTLADETVEVFLSEDFPKTAEIQILAADETMPQLEAYGHPDHFTEAELEEMVKTYNPSYLEAPLTLDHEQKGPNYGWVTGLVKRGKALFAKVAGLVPQLVNLVREGRYKTISPEIDLDFKKTGKLYIKAVSFLGAGKPACAGMANPVLSETGQLVAYLSDSGSKVFCGKNKELSLEEVGMIPQAQMDFDNYDLLERVQADEEREYLIKVLTRFYDAAWKVLDSDRTDKADLIRDYTDQLAEAVAEKNIDGDAELIDKGGTAMAGENKDLETKLAENAAELKKLQDEKLATEKRLAEMERTVKLRDIDRELSALVAEGKLTPAERNEQKLDALLACLPDGTVKLKDEKGGEKEITMRDWLLNVLKAHPQVIELGNRLTGGTSQPFGSVAAVLPRGITLAEIDQAGLDFAEKVREVQLRDKCDYATAMQRADKENPGLYDKTVKTKTR